jgi:hypothetical protein
VHTTTNAKPLVSSTSIALLELTREESKQEWSSAFSTGIGLYRNRRQRMASAIILPVCKAFLLEVQRALISYLTRERLLMR